jgi:hypothetical protein
MIFWLVLKLEISYRVLWYLEGFWFLLEDFFEDDILWHTPFFRWMNKKLFIWHIFEAHMLSFSHSFWVQTNW